LQLAGARRKGEKGFTLFELMIVLIIIGILVAIAMLVYRTEQDNVKIQTDAANVQILRGAAMRLLSDHELEREITWSETAGKDEPGIGWGAYLSAWPANPLRGGAATYELVITPAGEVKVSGNGAS